MNVASFPVPKSNHFSILGTSSIFVTFPFVKGIQIALLNTSLIYWAFAHLWKVYLIAFSKKKMKSHWLRCLCPEILSRLFRACWVRFKETRNSQMNQRKHSNHFSLIQIFLIKDGSSLLGITWNKSYLRIYFLISLKFCEFHTLYFEHTNPLSHPFPDPPCISHTSGFVSKFIFFRLIEYIWYCLYTLSGVWLFSRVC